MSPSMRSWLRLLAAPLLVALLPACGEKPKPPEMPAVCAAPGIPGFERSVAGPARAASLQAPADLHAFLRSSPGLTVLEEREVDGFRFFILDFEQPADHARPDGERFLQRMTLFHRSAEAPMVIDTEGQALFAEPIAAEPVYMLGGNQITVEHRFYGSSRPASGDWKLLTIEQASADFHRVVETLKPYYRGRWLSTGVFKGGTAAILHRYLYPDDVYATLPYALQHSSGLEDPRPAEHLARVGEDACRVRLTALQSSALERREELVPMLDELAADGLHFNTLGADKALEFTVVEMPFFFWQRAGLSPWTCAALPDPSAPAADLFSFVADVGGVFRFADELLQDEMSLRYQYATQFGAPQLREDPLSALLRYPGARAPARFPPAGVDKSFDAQLMERAAEWMRTDAARVLLVHGDLDPWASSTFDTNPCKDSYRLIASGSVGFYGELGDLTGEARTFVFDKLAQWGGVPVTDTPFPLDTRWRARAAWRHTPRSH